MYIGHNGTNKQIMLILNLNIRYVVIGVIAVANRYKY